MGGGYDPQSFAATEVESVAHSVRPFVMQPTG
ncbi:hypothetical protein HaLaN_11364, partial [Haematococcus lacustris]